jgi:hypothetical protein
VDSNGLSTAQVVVVPWLVAFARSSTTRVGTLDVMQFLNFESTPRKGCLKCTSFDPGYACSEGLEPVFACLPSFGTASDIKSDISCLAMVMAERCQLFVGKAQEHTPWRWLIASPQN